MTLRVLIVDDERLARERIRRMLRGEGDVEVVGECGDGPSAVRAVEEHAPDLLFLDVQMPGTDGFGVLDAIDPARMPVVVFVTAYDQYALRAFEVHALDYLVKPFNAERLRAALERARAHLLRGRDSHEGRLLRLLEQVTAERRELELAIRRSGGAGGGGAPAAAPPPPPPFVDRLLIRARGRVFFVRVADVDWFETAGNYVRVHVGREAHLVRESLTSLVARLDPARFARVHRSAAVNLDRVKEMQPWFSGDYVVILHSGARLRMSRTYREQLLRDGGRP